MKESYLAADFRETVTRRFPAQAEALRAAFDARVQELWAENAAASEEKKQHLRRQILPGIAAYETLQTVMPQAEALQTVHGYLEQKGRRIHRLLTAMLRLPGLYRLVPGIFGRSTRTTFGPAAGVAATELQTDSTIWRIDMTRCPYHDTCVQYGCPELCRCFCDCDDVSYVGLHPRLIWHRTKTLGRGGDCCDFCLKIGDPEEKRP